MTSNSHKNERLFHSDIIKQVSYEDADLTSSKNFQSTAGQLDFQKNCASTALTQHNALSMTVASTEDFVSWCHTY